MKIEKQVKSIECLMCGYYKVINGEIYTKLKGEFRIMIPNRLPSGYLQLTISNHKRGVQNKRVIVYKHVLIYLSEYGVYTPGYEIDHIDRDKNNTHPDNLRAVPPVVNNDNRANKDNGGCDRPIRGLEIDLIRTLMKVGRNQSEIARELNLNRLSVRYTVKNIEAGNTLKYEGVY